MQFTAPRDLEGVGRVGILNPQGDVGAQLFRQPLTDIARGDPFPFPAGKGGGVDDEIHGKRRLVDRDVGDRHRVLGTGQGLADANGVEAGHSDDITGARLLDLNLLEPFVAEQLGDAPFGHRTVLLDHGYGLTGLHLAVEDATGGDAADVVVVVDVGDQHLEGGLAVTLGGADVGLNHGEERLHSGGLGVHVQHGIAHLGAGIDHREVQLLIGGVQFTKQVKDHVENFVRAGTGAVDLVDDHDRLEPQVEGLLEHEAGLGHGAVQGVHQQQDGVDHLEDPFHFATEIGMAGGIDDIDLVLSVVDRKVLGQDGDAAFFLQVVAVHHALGDGLVLAVDPGVLEHGIHQGGLAVVDVGNNCDVSDPFLHR